MSEPGLTCLRPPLLTIKERWKADACTQRIFGVVPTRATGGRAPVHTELFFWGWERTGRPRPPRPNRSGPSQRDSAAPAPAPTSRRSPKKVHERRGRHEPHSRGIARRLVTTVARAASSSSAHGAGQRGCATVQLRVYVCAGWREVCPVALCVLVRCCRTVSRQRASTRSQERRDVRLM